MERKQKIVFIINPVSGVGKKNIIPPLIEKHLDKNKFENQIVYTEHRGHGNEIANQFKSQSDIIVAVGGDGSVNEIGSALVNSSCALGIIPCGSGNGLARHAGIPLKFDHAILRLNNKKPDFIDVGKVNDKLFLGTCGFGFDAHIAKKFDEYHKRGFFSYIKLVIKEFKNYKPHDFQIDLNGSKSISKAFMLSVANSSQFGNGFTISPLSELSDGKFEMIVLKPFKWFHAPGIARKFFSKSIHRSEFFEQFMFDSCLKLSLPNGQSASLHVDGEPSGTHEKFQVEILKSSLLLI
ncbi:MAG: hypothetical protein JNJ99_14820 [Crocinitomicaceae bacterium]|nr:hypothetical protein [Crocinitomicaceae bacterium]